jgi:hypothetical protein
MLKSYWKAVLGAPSEPPSGHDYRDIQAKLIRDVRLAEADCEILTRDIVAADLARVGEGVPPAARRCPEASYAHA